jgi:hydrogenase expression/formation protein HypE
MAMRELTPLIGLAHGNGGRRMRELIDEVFAARLVNTALDTRADAAGVALDGDEIVITTDGFTVQPLEFPGGDIGSLAVYGTVNDLAVAGAIPRYLALGVIIEEGFARARLERIADSIAAAARETGVAIVTGDTKVVPRGHGGGLYLTTTGIGGRAPGPRTGIDRIRAGDRVLVSGPVGDHGTAVLLAREQFGLRGDLRSDAASVLPLVAALRGLPGLRFLRDPTRGGLATVMHEIAAGGRVGVHLQESAIPVRDPVRSVCDILGYDPLFLACEGRVVAVVAATDAAAALARWRALPEGAEAAIVGEIRDAAPGLVMTTRHGGERWIGELEDDPLPRIC